MEAIDLFAPVQLGGLLVKNRFCRSATQDSLSAPGGLISPQEVALYEALAAGDVGLIFSAHLYVSPDGMASLNQNAIDRDDCIGPLSQAAQAAHRHGALFVAQLNHAGAKAVGGGQPLDVNAMSEPDFARVTNRFAQAARRARQAGCDGVQVHCAHGYLLSQLISPVTNRRADAYGASALGRFALAERIITAIREDCGPDFPVLIKINSNCEENDGAYAQDLAAILVRCQELGVTAAELSGCNFYSFPRDYGPFYLERAAQLRKGLDLPLILVGGVRTRKDAQQAVDAGMRMVSLCRPLISEPDLVRRLAAGQERCRCVDCNQCFAQVRQQGPDAPHCALDRA